MKIAHFLLGRCNPESANGIDKTVYYLSKAQASLGHNVTVLSLTHKPPIPIEGVIVKIFKPRALPFRLPNGYLKDLLEWRSPFNLPSELVKELLTWKPDIVHLHFVYIPQNVILAHYLKTANIPYCVTIHGGLSSGSLKRHWYIKIPFRILFDQRYLNEAAFIHAISDMDIKGLKLYGIKNNNVVKVPNGIEVESLPRNVDATLLERRFPQVAGKRVFMFLGRLDPQQKGLDLLLQAWHLANLNNVVLVFVGPDWRGKRKDLEALIRQLKIESQVIFAGPVYSREKFDLLAGADVFVHTSRWEAGVPFSVLEALAIGKPCFVSTEASPGGIISRYRVGLVVKPQVEDIANGLRYFASLSQAELSNMGENARKLVASEFNWRNIAKTLVDAYKDVLQRETGVAT